MFFKKIIKPMLIKEIGQLLPMQRDAMQGASWAKMMSPRSKLM
jgi:hypothetical protein